MKAVQDMTAAELLEEARRRDVARAEGRPLVGSSLRPDVAIEIQHDFEYSLRIDRLVIHGPPRTKKNGTTNGQHPRQFRDYKKMALEQLKRIELTRLAPDTAYNLEAHYYLDRLGERADLCGLLQATCDLLQNAGVIEDDRWFKGFDRSRPHTIDEPGFESPRAVITITPL